MSSFKHGPPNNSPQPPLLRFGDAPSIALGPCARPWKDTRTPAQTAGTGSSTDPAACGKLECDLPAELRENG